MGYKVRLIVATHFDSNDKKFLDEYGSKEVEVVADIYMGKLDYYGPYHALIREARNAPLTSIYHFYTVDYDENEKTVRVSKDLYDDYILPLKVEDVEDALEREGNKNTVPAQSALKALQELWVDRPLEELMVFHYGY